MCIVPVSRPMMRAIVTEGWRVFHALVLTGRVPRARILGNLPSAADLRRIRAQHPVRMLVDGPTEMHVRRSRYAFKTPVNIIIDWLYATRTMSDSQLGDHAKADWVRVFTQSDDERSRLLAQSSSCRIDTLRQARTRLDCVAMLVWRAMFALMNPELLCLYVFCDASPQRRGMEMFASSIDIIAADFTRRLLLPVVSLGRCCLGVQGD